MPRVTFIPDNVTIEVAQGENLLRAAMMADVRRHRLVRWRRHVRQVPHDRREGRGRRDPPRIGSPPTRSPRGYVLACLTTVTGDVTVRIPPESRPGAAPARARSGRIANPVLSAEEQAVRLPDKSSALAVRQVPCGGHRARQRRQRERPRRACSTRCAATTASSDVEVISLAALRELPEVLREGELVGHGVRQRAVRHAARSSPASRPATRRPASTRSPSTWAPRPSRSSLIDLVTRADRRARPPSTTRRSHRGEDVISAHHRRHPPGRARRAAARSCSSTHRDTPSTRCWTRAGVSADDIVAYYVGRQHRHDAPAARRLARAHPHVARTCRPRRPSRG